MVRFIDPGIRVQPRIPHHAVYQFVDDRGNGVNAAEAFMDDLRQTLDKFGVPAQEQGELKAIVESTRADIVVKPESTPAS